MQTDEDVDVKEIEVLLHNEQDQDDFEESSQDEDEESNPITAEDDDVEEEMDELSLDNQEELQQVETVDKEDDKTVEEQPTEEQPQQSCQRSERTRKEPTVLSHNDRGQQVDAKVQQCHQAVDKVRVEKKHNLFHTAKQVNECSTQEAMVTG